MDYSEKIISEHVIYTKAIDKYAGEQEEGNSYIKSQLRKANKRFELACKEEGLSYIKVNSDLVIKEFNGK